MTVKLGDNFGLEVAAAGLPDGLAWNYENGDIFGAENWTAAQKTKLQEVIAAHDPNASPTNVKAWERALDFKLEFLIEERVAMREFAVNDVIAADFLDLLNSGGRIVANDPLLIAGLQYMVTNQVLTQTRVNEVLGVQ